MPVGKQPCKHGSGGGSSGKTAKVKPVYKKKGKK